MVNLKLDSGHTTILGIVVFELIKKIVVKEDRDGAKRASRDVPENHTILEDHRDTKFSKGYGLNKVSTLLILNLSRKETTSPKNEERVLRVVLVK